MTDKELFFFAAKCLALDENTGFKNEIISNAQSGRVDWQDFVALCSNHLILPAIFIKFKTHRILEHLPNELTDYLQEVYELNEVRNRGILDQLHEIVDELNKRGIAPIFLKGAAYLLDGLFPIIGERMLGDIDFLVEEKNYLLSASLLKQAGYQEVKETPEYKDINTFKHYPLLFHPAHAATVEIHRIPTDESFLGWFNAEILDREKIVPASLTGCFVLSDKHKIVHNFIHSQLSNEGFLYGTVSLREIYDVYLLSKRFPLERVLPEIKSKQKAIAYFALARNLLGLDDSFFRQKNLAYRILRKRLALHIGSRRFYNFSRGLIFIFQRIFSGYFGQILKAIYSKQKRQYLSRRIRSRKWYGDHVRLYTGFFRHRKNK
ncbi:nucleotidyltransferase family protein [Gaoshiqia sediminis]|uniref:Nucleotidyltransferase family protein n=1 Tax=Gaoshiqia sediminis TaxID=2986998 RepID=A0AA41Y592_9BACT|nr:nucleotidyltransferase family protein [Gaoshiqia sediminis]MCW0481123.1 nucleotidyltransferase family protein [Gaoshiqia sediminis]